MFCQMCRNCLNDFSEYVGMGIFSGMCSVHRLRRGRRICRGICGCYRGLWRSCRCFAGAVSGEAVEGSGTVVKSSMEELYRVLEELLRAFRGAVEGSGSLEEL